MMRERLFTDIGRVPNSEIYENSADSIMRIRPFIMERDAKGLLGQSIRIRITPTCVMADYTRCRFARIRQAD